MHQTLPPGSVRIGRVTRMFPNKQCVGITATCAGFGVPTTLFAECNTDGPRSRSFTVTSMQRDRKPIDHVDKGESCALYLGVDRDHLPPHGSIIYIVP
ncbi:MAG: hypothetical protein V1685_07480 [Parcubacteria group bacterium]